jgi:hypothetical protein
MYAVGAMRPRSRRKENGENEIDFAQALRLVDEARLERLPVRCLINSSNFAHVLSEYFVSEVNAPLFV